MTSNKSTKKSPRSRRPLASGMPTLSSGSYPARRLRVPGGVTHNPEGSNAVRASVASSSDDPLASVVLYEGSNKENDNSAHVHDVPVEISMPVDVQASDSESFELEGEVDDAVEPSLLMPGSGPHAPAYVLTDADAAAFPSLSEGDREAFLQRLSVEDLARLCDGGLLSIDDVGGVFHHRLHVLLAPFGFARDDLLEMLKWTEGVIAGSSVLGLLYPGMSSPGGLDFFIGSEFSTAALAFFRRNGYRKTNTFYTWERGCRANRRHMPPSKVYGSRRGSDEPVKEIHELTNDSHPNKVMVFVSPSVSVLPLLRCPTTLCMNYIAHHGVVILHRLTLSRIGLKNYPADEITHHLQSFYRKYEERGFQLWDTFQVEHDCSVDERCPLKPRSLFDSHVVHFRWPQFRGENEAVLRRREADILWWRSGAALACDPTSNDRYGFYICNDQHRMLTTARILVQGLEVPAFLNFPYEPMKYSTPMSLYIFVLHALALGVRSGCPRESPHRKSIVFDEAFSDSYEHQLDNLSITLRRLAEGCRDGRSTMNHNAVVPTYQLLLIESFGVGNDLSTGSIQANTAHFLCKLILKLTSGGLHRPVLPIKQFHLKVYQPPRLPLCLAQRSLNPSGQVVERLLHLGGRSAPIVRNTRSGNSGVAGERSWIDQGPTASVPRWEKALCLEVVLLDSDEVALGRDVTFSNGLPGANLKFVPGRHPAQIVPWDQYLLTAEFPFVHGISSFGYVPLERKNHSFLSENSFDLALHTEGIHFAEPCEESYSDRSWSVVSDDDNPLPATTASRSNQFAPCIPNFHLPGQEVACQDVDVAEFTSLNLDAKRNVASTLPIDALARLVNSGGLSSSMIGEALLSRSAAYFATFNLDVAEVLLLLKWTESILAGQVVLAIMFPGLFVPNHIDIYVGVEFEAVVLSYLRGRGYVSDHVIHPSASYGSADPLPAHLAYRPYFRPTEQSEVARLHEVTDPSGRKVVVIVTLTVPIFPLLRSPSTLTMNYVAQGGAIDAQAKINPSRMVVRSSLKAIKGTEISVSAKLRHHQPRRVDYSSLASRNTFVACTNVSLSIAIARRPSLQGWLGSNELTGSFLPVIKILARAVPDDEITPGTQLLYDRYKKWGFHHRSTLPGEHNCNADLRCPQASRSLFDDGVAHFLFPLYANISGSDGAVFRRHEASILRWRLATALSCGDRQSDQHGFILCNSRCSVVVYHYSPSVERLPEFQSQLQSGNLGFCSVSSPAAAYNKSMAARRADRTFLTYKAPSRAHKKKIRFIQSTPQNPFKKARLTFAFSDPRPAGIPNTTISMDADYCYAGGRRRRGWWWLGSRVSGGERLTPRRSPRYVNTGTSGVRDARASSQFVDLWEVSALTRFLFSHNRRRYAVVVTRPGDDRIRWAGEVLGAVRARLEVPEVVRYDDQAWVWTWMEGLCEFGWVWRAMSARKVWRLSIKHYYIDHFAEPLTHKVDVSVIYSTIFFNQMHPLAPIHNEDRWANPRARARSLRNDDESCGMLKMEATGLKGEGGARLEAKRDDDLTHPTLTSRVALAHWLTPAKVIASPAQRRPLYQRPACWPTANAPFDDRAHLDGLPTRRRPEPMAAEATQRYPHADPHMSASDANDEDICRERLDDTDVFMHNTACNDGPRTTRRARRDEGTPTVSDHPEATVNNDNGVCALPREKDCWLKERLKAGGEAGMEVGIKWRVRRCIVFGVRCGWPKNSRHAAMSMSTDNSEATCARTTGSRTRRLGRGVIGGVSDWGETSYRGLSKSAPVSRALGAAIALLDGAAVMAMEGCFLPSHTDRRPWAVTVSRQQHPISHRFALSFHRCTTSLYDEPFVVVQPNMKAARPSRPFPSCPEASCESAP
ncbi:hypothetical protein DFP72DRAFT_860120 [Ephemerocybe angulata]|uniref:Uncharacterized protein n=1 Tax=Ephemerocybe angulata TaxID=980116 RepID=A0A8H6H964_9AGAR|nr:hypothetical protein DFP72DRAFT_860120 [Tulosesus angulatus]